MRRWLQERFGRATSADPRFPSDALLAGVRFVVLDTEFTSLDHRSNRLLSIGAIVMEGTRIKLGEQFYKVVNPGVDVPAHTVVLHKLRPADVESGDAPARALEDFRAFIEGSVLVGHFVAIDIKVLHKELGGDKLANPVVDTARVHRWLLRRERHSEDLFHKLENVDLASLAKHYHLPSHEAHHALDDAFLTARLWQKLLAAAEQHGVATLGELTRIGRI